MRRRLLTIGSFAALAPLTILLSVGLLLNLRPKSVNPPLQVLGASTGSLLSDSTPDIQGVSGEPLLADARPILIKNYLQKWNSPLTPYAGLIVSTADNNGVDPLLVVAIAQQESNLGRRGVANCFNAWGWAQTSVYTRCFDSWPQAIKAYIQEFAENYVKKGLTTPEEIMSKYNPASPDGSWAKGVTQFLSELVSSAS